MSCDWWDWSVQTTAAVEAENARLAESKRVQAAAAVKSDHDRLAESNARGQGQGEPRVRGR